MSTVTVPDIGPLYGSLYFATVLSAGLYGVSCMQTFFYYVHYHDEPLWLRSFVAILWVLGTTHQALITAGVFKFIVAGLVDQTAQTHTNSELVILMTSLTAVLTEFFFIWRIYIFSGRNPLGPAILVPATLYQLVSALVYMGKVLYSSDGVQVVANATLNDSLLVGLFSSCMFVSAAVDILIAIFLSYLLYRQRAALKSTVHILQRLTVLSVNTGIWTALFALIAAILLQVFPTTMLFDILGMPLCGLYGNTLLANLNSRKYVRGFTAIDEGGGDGLVSLRPVGNSRGEEYVLGSVGSRRTQS